MFRNLFLTEPVRLSDTPTTVYTGAHKDIIKILRYNRIVLEDFFFSHKMSLNASALAPSKNPRLMTDVKTLHVAENYLVSLDYGSTLFADITSKTPEEIIDCMIESIVMTLELVDKDTTDPMKIFPQGYSLGKRVYNEA